MVGLVISPILLMESPGLEVSCSMGCLPSGYLYSLSLGHSVIAFKVSGLVLVPAKARAENASNANSATRPAAYLNDVNLRFIIIQLYVIGKIYTHPAIYTTDKIV